eukprot:TRINITY_DN73344_c0_g1_i1.p1 TRINITY_DN73344_c0_g1~~TRINITY_DN73344_c0_g1_i1.p1  ORF type:complete len:380 (+),score=27.47 TRINITY_DN73344_c0_g1_i1:44-1141(+)
MVTSVAAGAAVHLRGSGWASEGLRVSSFSQARWIPSININLVIALGMSCVIFFVVAIAWYYSNHVQTQKGIGATLDQKAKDVVSVKIDSGDVSFDTVVEDDRKLEHWKRSSGLHTVEEWCSRYNEHPGAWGALLMIQGVPEVTSRLRRKVDNYAIYSALFLSGSMALIMYQSPKLDRCGSSIECHILQHVYFYTVSSGMIAHLLCIVLAMAFSNALNEAARDSDVIRMFARGQGYYATVKCECCFFLGALFIMIACATILYTCMGIDIVIFTVVGTAIAVKVYFDTASPLFKTASIINYWRKELGGEPDSDDAYDITLPLNCLQHRMYAGRNLSSAESAHRTHRQAPSIPEGQEHESVVSRLLHH